jgi:uncharacterized repeat protein (TIGR01451 family)
MPSSPSHRRFGRAFALATSLLLAVGAIVIAAPSAALAVDPELTVTNSVSEPVAHPGDQIVYTISISNTGATDASGYYLHDYFSDALTFVSATGSPGDIDFFGIPGYTHTYIWFGSIDVLAGQTVTRTVTGTVNVGTDGLTISNGVFLDLGAAAVTHDTPCSGLPFTGSCAETLVTPSVPAVTVTVQTCTSLNAAQCDPNVDADWSYATHFPVSSLASFRVVVSNAGDGDLTGVSASVLTALAIEEAPVVTTGSAVFPTWTIGLLAHGTSATLSFRARLSASAGGAPVSVQASGTSGTTTVADSGTTIVSATPILAETGIDISALLACASVLGFVGLVLVLLRRRLLLES